MSRTRVRSPLRSLSVHGRVQERPETGALQVVDELPQQRRLAHAPRPEQHDGSLHRLSNQLSERLVVCATGPPGGRIRAGGVLPPGIIERQAVSDGRSVNGEHSPLE